MNEFDPGTVGGKRVLVYSLGIEGRDLATWFVARGAHVTMSDTRSAAQLEAAHATAPEGVEHVETGGALLAPDGFDVLAVSQSVLRHSAEVVRARELGIPVVSQTQLFLDLCPGRICGISGSSGKSTTTALIGEMAVVAGIDHVVGGNIGRGLLNEAERIAATTWVVLEISHTQLQYTTRSPKVAVLTNVTPNHLDQFPWPEYVGLKANLLRFQGPEDIAVMNQGDPESRKLAQGAKGDLTWFGRCERPSVDGAYFDGRDVVVRYGGEEIGRFGREIMRLRGEHNLENVLAACAAAAAMGLRVETMERAVSAFRGVPHRLEVVGRAAGALWIDDSIATSPERTAAAIRAFEEPVILLLGGREKQLPLDQLKALVASRARAIVCFGEAGPLFYRELAGSVPTAHLVEGLSDAVGRAAEVVEPGDVVLLSPAGTSFDAYPNFEARGDAFAALVRALPGFEPGEGDRG